MFLIYVNFMLIYVKNIKKKINKKLFTDRRTDGRTDNPKQAAEQEREILDTRRVLAIALEDE